MLFILIWSIMALCIRGHGDCFHESRTLLFTGRARYGDYNAQCNHTVHYTLTKTWIISCPTVPGQTGLFAPPQYVSKTDLQPQQCTFVNLHLQTQYW
ncbi:hypothetical protein Alg130_00829 [Pyrenophora tritici-repentis]|nr:hypothetical protein Alg130_00829 [Pyrenophora tritici-repentis]